MTFDVVAALRNPDISIADLEDMRDRALGRPYVSEVGRAIAEAAQAEIDRRAAQRASHRIQHPKGDQ
ncbi:hypothetical protein [Streptomyces sp. NPDC097640]|uniref:hypothetical protein n=1 Tax=Streptomyces sp. NPDC097640 TaxID=3157229 RepID=UPI0033307323